MTLGQVFSELSFDAMSVTAAVVAGGHVALPQARHEISRSLERKSVNDDRYVSGTVESRTSLMDI